MTKETPNLDAAYGLETPEDSKKLYADWAESYDQDFAAERFYLLPEIAARCFVEAGGRSPVLDVGAGTGLCGVELTKLGVRTVDATDISAQMLEQAAKKDVYRDMIEADLTLGVPVPRDSYAGVVSSGTFTHGHVGPEVLPLLLRVARRDALFSLSINAGHYESHGFATMFDQLIGDGAIRNLRLPEYPIYGDGATGSHKDDTALIALFRKT
ncbi:MAG: methyltransferase domain-containing protein [Rhodobacteraceae bacterium]|nr:methyltransferase domain-containing protein [Paracoccaceae bacterium]